MKTPGLLVCWTQVCFCCSGDHFPIEARHHLAPWIDQNFTADLDLGNPQHEEHAQRLAMELVGQLESKAGTWRLPWDNLFPPDKILWLGSLQLTYLMIIIFPGLSWIRLEYFDQNEVLLSIRLPGTSLIISKNSFKFCVPKPT